jgi:signal transduction histidine kinase
MSKNKVHPILKNTDAIAALYNKNELIRLEQMKSDFICRASHNLRTPLTTILLMMRLLEGDCSPEEQLRYWQVLKEEVEHERQMIEDLADVEQLESGHWQVSLYPLSPLPALSQALQEIAPQAADKNIQIDILLPDEEIQVMGDSSALQKVFANLLSNAVKFTPPDGHLSVQVQLANHECRFTIKDDGIGISPEDMPNLFMRFFRARNATEGEIQGSGIGLYITKSIITYLGGWIQASSKLSKGTTFVFCLPLLSSEFEKRMDLRMREQLSNELSQQRESDTWRLDPLKKDHYSETWYLLPDSC